MTPKERAEEALFMWIRSPRTPTGLKMMCSREVMDLAVELVAEQIEAALQSAKEEQDAASN